MGSGSAGTIAVVFISPFTGGASLLAIPIPAAAMLHGTAVVAGVLVKEAADGLILEKFPAAIRLLMAVTRQPCEGIDISAKWGNPKSTKAYGHSVSRHGAKRPTQELLDRAKSTGEEQGQWYNDNFIVQAEQIAPLEPGAHIVEMNKSIGRVIFPDGTILDNVTRAIVVRSRDLTLITSYPIK